MIAWRGVVWLAGSLLILPVKGYQWLIRPLLPPLCRFEPSCSNYFILAVRKHGPLVGSLKGTWRICRCNPWGGTGFDPP